MGCATSTNKRGRVKYYQSKCQQAQDNNQKALEQQNDVINNSRGLQQMNQIQNQQCVYKINNDINIQNIKDPDQQLSQDGQKGKEIIQEDNISEEIQQNQKNDSQEQLLSEQQSNQVTINKIWDFDQTQIQQVQVDYEDRGSQFKDDSKELENYQSYPKQSPEITQSGTISLSNEDSLVKEQLKSKQFYLDNDKPIENNQFKEIYSGYKINQECEYIFIVLNNVYKFDENKLKSLSQQNLEELEVIQNMKNITRDSIYVSSDISVLAYKKSDYENIQNEINNKNDNLRIRNNICSNESLDISASTNINLEK